MALIAAAGNLVCCSRLSGRGLGWGCSAGLQGPCQSPWETLTWTGFQTIILCLLAWLMIYHGSDSSSIRTSQLKIVYQKVLMENIGFGMYIWHDPSSVHLSHEHVVIGKLSSFLLSSNQALEELAHSWFLSCQIMVAQSPRCMFIFFTK